MWAAWNRLGYENFFPDINTNFLVEEWKMFLPVFSIPPC